MLSLLRRLPFHVFLVTLVTVGCTHSQLRSNTINQMATVHAIQQQQVLDNLAMFVTNHDAYPYYSLVPSGTSTVTDQGALAIPNGFGRVGRLFLYTTLGVNPTVQRQAQEQWQITPINDSVKLSMMRCVYQRAVEGCLGLPPSTSCPDCRALESYFYGAFEPPAHEVPPPPSAAAAPPIPHTLGIVTPRCLEFAYCWFLWGPKNAVPKDCDCSLVGHYCGTYVWVPPEGRNQLTQLTLLIQDIAYYDAPASAGGGGRFAPPGAPSPGRMPSPMPYTMQGMAQTIKNFTPQPPLALPPN